MQTEKAKSSHFDRTKGDKNQIFPTLVNAEFTSLIPHLVETGRCEIPQST